MQIFKRIALAMVLALTLSAPSMATDRITWYYGMNPPSSWLNWMQRTERIGNGTTLAMLFGSTIGFYYNLSVNPASGLYVTVAPTNANTDGAIYQYLPEETSTWGGPGVTALPTDATQVYLQGLVSATSPTIGPLSPPGTVGQSINYAIECQVQTIDTTSQTQTFVTSTGVQSSAAVNQFRQDEGNCQYKAGTAATTGTQTNPTIDTGWVGIAYIPVAYGASTISGGSIVPITSSQFSSSRILNASGAPLGTTSHTVFLTFTTSVSPTTCGPLVSYYCSSATLSGGAQFTNGTSFTCSPGWSTPGAGQNLAGYTGSYYYVAAFPGNFYALWLTAASPVTTIYVGATQAAATANTVTITCTGY